MSLKTEMDIQMTLKISGRDEATGAMVEKLNNLFSAVEALGGTTSTNETQTETTEQVVSEDAPAEIN